jgi:hypothetical protein
MSAGYLVHFRALAHGVSVSGKVRAIPAQYIREHGALCAAFGLDPVRTAIDVPRSWGEAPSPGRIQQAIVLFEGEPLGHLTIMREGERTPDDNPTDPRDFFNLSNRI